MNFDSKIKLYLNVMLIQEQKHGLFGIIDYES